MLDRIMNRYASYAPLALRIVVGVVFAMHGAQKLFGAFGGPGIDGTAQFFEQTGIVPGVFWAWVVGLVEFCGGLALLLGACTRYAASLLAIIMLVAIFAVHLSHGFFLPQGSEYALTLFGANLTLLFSGAGELALDPFLKRWWSGWRHSNEPHSATA
ncbi:MAG TPA: DoxX family protein [Blastocatellia bacterium]|nr:DoxX family protein [Blastocatellia bacterium]